MKPQILDSPLRASIDIDSLRGAAEFDPVFKQGRKVEVGCVSARVLAREGGSAARLGLIVPKKKAKRAVDRNAVKRVVRESFLARLRELGLEERSVDVVVQFKGVPKASMGELKAFKALVAADAAAALGRALPAPKRRATLG